MRYATIDTRPENGRAVLYGVDWQDRRPYLQFVALGAGEIQQFELRPGATLGLGIERRNAACTGWIDFAEPARPTKRPCASESFERGQCSDCWRREGFAGCIRCDGEQCPNLGTAQTAFCRSDHILYLATFDGRDVKAGVAAVARQLARLDEQGPVAAEFVAKGSGPAIKRLEAQLHGMGMTGAMTHRQKLKLLSTPPEVAPDLSDARTMALRAVEHAGLGSAQPYEPPPGQAGVRRLARSCRPITKLDGLRLWAEVIGVIGTIVVVEDGVGPALVDIWSLRGALVTWEIERSDANRQEQGTLF